MFSVFVFNRIFMASVITGLLVICAGSLTKAIYLYFQLYYLISWLSLSISSLAITELSYNLFDLLRLVRFGDWPFSPRSVYGRWYLSLSNLSLANLRRSINVRFDFNLNG